MDHHRDTRASDRDREAAAERLRLAVEEGCLDLEEFNDRLGLAYRSLTRRQLADLPAERRPTRPPAPRGAPRWLKLLWAGWAAVLAVNIAIWAAVSAAEECPVEFWPKGLFVPGLILAIVTAVTIVRSRDAIAEGP